jgi:aryl-alcohol dehydrogenase-like predicted oxidoreductase
VIGIGGWQFGGGDYWGGQDQKDINDVVAKALESGCTYFDTAQAYDDGKSEIALGNALKQVPDSSKAIIGTKIMPGNAAPKLLRKAVQVSLERLQIPCIHLLMLHWPTDTNPMPAGTPADEIPDVKSTFQTLIELQNEGLIKHIGLSNFGVQQMKEVLATGVKIVINQLPYGLFLRMIELEIIPFCQEHGIGVIGYSPLLQGLLTGKYTSIDELPDYRTRTRHFAGTRNRSRHGGPGCEPELLQALADIRKVSEREGVTMTILALAWCLKNPAICCIIPGTRNLAQLEDNVKAAHYQMSDEVYKELCDATEPVKSALGHYVDIYQSNENQRTK